MVTRFVRSRLMSVSVSIDTADCDVKKRWRPRSLMPGKFSRRNDCNVDGKALSTKFVNEFADSPEMARCRSPENWRKFPTIARKLSDADLCWESWCNTKVDSIV
jgi:hypothetical protein